MYFNANEDIRVLEFTFDSGKEKNLSAYYVRNKTFACVLVKDHALDIAFASYKGIGVSFLCRNGLSYKVGDFPKTFEGGLLYTCGLDNVSNCVEDVYTHGTMHNTPSSNTSYEVKDQKVVVHGTMLMTGLFCDGLQLHREIHITAKGVEIKDTIENLRNVDAKYCLLYHCNFGAPFLQENGYVSIPCTKKEGLTPYAKSCEKSANKITAPIPNEEEVVYYHEGHNGIATYLNTILNIAVDVQCDKEKMPYIIEWKSMAEDDYALGLEPSTTRFDTFQMTNIPKKGKEIYSLKIIFRNIKGETI